MRLLGVAWTTFPISFKGQKICSTGLYRYVRHPNYLIVIVEIFLIPLLGKCYITSIFFGVINFIFLIRRIKIEEAALSLLPDYSKVFTMKKKLIPFLYLFLCLNFAHGREITLESKDFEEAQKQESYFKFIGESKKFGLISTSFEGYAKKFTLSFDERDNLLENISLVIDLKKLDTDNDSRNEKMWDLCLNTKEFPSLKIKIEKITLSEESQTLKGLMEVRGSIIDIPIKIKKINSHQFEGESHFKLSQAKIPDPSIAIASVNDEFQIKFSLRLK